MISNFLANSDRRCYILHKRMEAIDESGRFDIVLTPRFYEIKKVALPLKFTFQAKKIAPSLFEGLVGQERSDLHYFVYKDADEWIFIAYNPAEIVDFLKNEGIDIRQIDKICFLQQLTTKRELFPFKLSSEEIVDVVDGIAVLVPSGGYNESETLPTKRYFRFDSDIKILKTSLPSSRSEFVSAKHFVIFSVVAGLFSLFWMIEGWRIANARTDIEIKLQELYERYPALQSRYKLESILQKYRKIDKAERRKRELLKTFSSLRRKGVEIVAIDLSSKGFEAEFVVDSDTSSASLIRMLTRKKLNYTKKDDRHIVIRGNLDAF